MYHLYALFLIYTWQSLILYFLFLFSSPRGDQCFSFRARHHKWPSIATLCGPCRGYYGSVPLDKSLSLISLYVCCGEGGREREVIWVWRGRTTQNAANRFTRPCGTAQPATIYRRAALLHSGWAERERKKKTYSATQDGKKEGLYDMRDVSWIVHIWSLNGHTSRPERDESERWEAMKLTWGSWAVCGYYRTCWSAAAAAGRGE